MTIGILSSKDAKLPWKCVFLHGRRFDQQKWKKSWPVMKRTHLGEFEEIVLLIVAFMEGKAYGISIAHEIIRQTNRSVGLNQVHASLQRLEEKGMVASKMGDPTRERGGRRKRIFTITAFGQQTLQDIQTVRSNLWSLLPSSVKPSGL